MTNKEIENRCHEINEERHKLEEELIRLDFEEGKNAFGEKYPVGSVMEYRGKKYFVRTYERHWIKASPFKKDGSPSEMVQNLYGTNTWK
jgi:hypothetical protein